MRSRILRSWVEIGVMWLAVWGMGACSSDDIQLGTGASSSTATGAGGMGGMPSSSTGAVVVSSGAGTLSGGTGGEGAGGPSGACADTLLITYDVTGKLAITDTPSGLGDTVKDIGPGTMKIRFQSMNGAPVAGFTTLVSYSMPMKYEVDIGGLVVSTDVTVNAGVDECGIAIATPIGYLLDWDMCQYDPMTWTPQAAGNGPGCVHGYHTTGNVNCNDMSMQATCMDVNLMDGDNPQDFTWDQPFNTLEFSMDLKSFQMQNLDGPAPPAGTVGVETPNDAPGRTWLSLNGVETERLVVATPACACPP